MFVDFMYQLRSYGLKVSSNEWQTLLQALERGHAAESLNRFYYLARAICCRTELDYDAFDRCFAEFFEGITYSESLKDEFNEWLKNAKPPRALTAEEKAAMQALGLDELKDMFEQRMREQKERHDGGNRWVGTGGTSPFGSGGYNPAGIRVGEGGGMSALQVASQRLFRNFRSDVIIDTRQIGLALRKLRHWGREGHAAELDLEASIEATGRNAGDITLMFRPERKNNQKLLLLMDVGGSMTYHTQICEQLFSAAYKSVHFKEFRYYYFHNCPYDFMFTDMEQQKRVLTRDLLQTLDSTWLLIFVGDAAMAPYELTEVGGAIDYFQQNAETGLTWIDRLRKHFPCSVWLNPEPAAYWQRPSNQLIRTVIPDMFPMSLQGIDEAIAALKRMKQKRE
ncbi:MAG TPA: VWA domain-containing protein [Oligoflexus sp.]|uniref:vWA domain-containing protein n=1 Tax=Oligoflexus sp. TaxID=1971216 RepID=UPI002D2EEA03|nr:VWA domain-containing protein [Oligoflexus sp.]HYX38023.1 VWA domain-containing protein [Oligoflexus sp.]